MRNLWLLPDIGRLKPLRQDDQTTVMYAVKLKSPLCEQLDVVDKKDQTSCHIFTENEINRANVRFFTQTGTNVDKKLALGYIGSITLINNQGVVVTRYIVNLCTKKGVGTMLFSVREYRRSIERYRSLMPEKKTFGSMLLGLFKK